MPITYVASSNGQLILVNASGIDTITAGLDIGTGLPFTNVGVDFGGPLSAIGGLTVTLFDTSPLGLTATVTGGETADIININDIRGSSANDTFLVSSSTGSAFLVQGGSGIDTLSFANFGAAVAVDVTAGTSSNGVASFSGFEVFVGSDFADSFTATGPGLFTILSSDGGDNYDLGGFGTLSYANQSTALLVDIGNGQVTGKGDGSSDSFAFSPLGRVIGGSGIDTLSFADVGAAIAVDVTAGTSSDGVASFSGFEIYLGTGFNDTFTATASALFTILSSDGSDIYDLGGFGTLSYASQSTNLIIDFAVGSVSGKGDGSSDSFAGSNLASLIVGSGSDNITLTTLYTNNVSIEGGLGYDTARLIGLQVDWLLLANPHTGASSFQSVADGHVVTLSSVERVEFDDAVVSTAAYVPNDFFGDGHSTILTYGGLTGGEIWFWRQDGTQPVSYNGVAALDQTWDLLGSANAFNTGHSDLVFWNRVSGEVSFWGMNGLSVATTTTDFTMDTAVWRNIGLGDLNADGLTDLVWQSKITGEVFAWEMDGTGLKLAEGSVGSGPGSNFDQRSVADLNGDGKADILWRDTLTGDFAVWAMDGLTHSSTTTFTIATSFSLKGLGDFNGDGIADLVLEDDASHSIRIQSMSATGLPGAHLDFALPVGWTVEQTGDYNGDGLTDLVLSDNGSSSMHGYFVAISSGSGIASTYFTGAAHYPEWVLLGDGFVRNVLEDRFVGTVSDETLLLDANSHLLSADGLGGIDTLSFASLTAAVTVDVTAGTASIGVPSFSNFEIFIGTGLGDSFTATAPGLLTILSSNGADDYDLGGFATLSYANQATDLLVDVGNGQVSGKGDGSIDNFSFSPLGAVIGGAGHDTLSFADLGIAIAVDVTAGTASNGVASFSGFERYIGSGLSDIFTATAAAGFTILSSDGNDNYDLGGFGTLSYANQSTGLTIDFDAGTVTGKGDASSDSFAASTIGQLIAGSANDMLLFGTAYGNDLTVNGGAGVDTAVLTGNAADWGVLSNTHNGAASFQSVLDGHLVTLTSVEHVQFDDAVLQTGPLAPNNFFGDGHSASATYGGLTGGELWFWQQDGTHTVSCSAIAYQDPSWTVLGSGNVYNTATADILWWNPTNGDVSFWNMNGTTLTLAEVPLHLDPAQWRSVGIGDMNGDGLTDMVWQDINTGDVLGWQMDGHGRIASEGSIGSAQAANFNQHLLGDVTGDGKADIVWRDTTTGDFEVWQMDGLAQVGSAISFSLAPGYNMIGIGDFNGDGIGDLFMDDTGNHTAHIQLMTAAGTAGGTVDIALLNGWSVADIGDYNADGLSDLLVSDTNVSSSYGYIAIMSSGTGAASGYYAGSAANPEWYLVG